MPKQHTQRSGCPINLTLEILGDKWSLILIRDVIFGGKRHFRELLNDSLEGIPSNTLADRLKSLEAHGILTRAADPSHRQKVIYSLTEQGIQLLPLLVQAGSWGRRYLAASEELSVRARIMEDGGEPLLSEFMDELRAEHLSTPANAAGSAVRARLQAEYERVIGERR